jgi:hypothetical protein
MEASQQQEPTPTSGGEATPRSRAATQYVILGRDESGYYRRVEEIVQDGETGDTVAARSPEAAVDSLTDELKDYAEVIAVPESAWHRFVRQPGFKKV